MEFKEWAQLLYNEHSKEMVDFGSGILGPDYGAILSVYIVDVW